MGTSHEDNTIQPKAGFFIFFFLMSPVILGVIAICIGFNSPVIGLWRSALIILILFVAESCFVIKMASKVSPPHQK